MLSQKEGNLLKLAISANPENATIIQELLSPWEVSWSFPENSDIVIVYDKKPLEAYKKTILIPSNSIVFEKWTKQSKHTVVRRLRVPVSIAAVPEINLSFTPEAFYEVKPATSEGTEDLVIPKLDLVDEYKRIIWQTLNAKSSLTYRFATSFPLSYNIAPKRLKDYLMKKHNEGSMLNLYDILPLDALRFELKTAIEHLSKEKLHKNIWARMPSVCALTHDVDGEVGSHDTKHDGRLSYLSKKELNERLSEGKRILKSMTNQPVVGFRAPLLQHTSAFFLV